MRLTIFAIYDSKAAAFLQPFFAPNSDVAQRMVIQAAQDPSSTWALFGADYTLFQLGHFEDADGKFDIHAAYQSCGNVLTMIERFRPQVQDPKVHSVHGAAPPNGGDASRSEQMITEHFPISVQELRDMKENTDNG